MAEQKTQAEIEAEEKLAKEAEAKKVEAEEAAKKSQQIEVDADGKVRLTEEQYKNLVNFKEDMHKYKGRAKTAEELLEKINTEKENAEKKQLEEQKKFQELYENEKTSKEEIQKKIESQKLDNAVNLAAVKAGIAKPEYVKLIDKSKVTTDPDTGDLVGIDDLILVFKEENPNLFVLDSDTVPVDKTLGGKSTGVLSDDEVRTLTGAQIKTAKEKNKPLYERWLKLCQQGRQS